MSRLSKKLLFLPGSDGRRHHLHLGHRVDRLRLADQVRLHRDGWRPSGELKIFRSKSVENLVLPAAPKIEANL